MSDTASKHDAGGEKKPTEGEWTYKDGVVYFAAHKGWPMRYFGHALEVVEAHSASLADEREKLYAVIDEEIANNNKLRSQLRAAIGTAVDHAELAALREKVSDLEAELSSESEALDEINARNKQLRSQLEAAEAAMGKAKSAYESFFDEADAIMGGTSTNWQHLSLDQWRTRRECMAAVLALFPDMGNPAYR